MSELEEYIKDLAEGVEYAEGIAYNFKIEVKETLELIPKLFEKIRHGEPGHEAWLEEAIKCHFLGKPMPEYAAK